MTTPLVEPRRQTAESGGDIPPLENGDVLSRDEFERRYGATPGVKKAELVEGVVFMAPPALRWDYHGRPDGLLGTWLGVYELSTPGVQMGHNSSIRLDLKNEPQPDVAMIIEPACGGQVRISADGYIEGVPELVVEISSSSVSIDLNAKFRAYQRNGVREYIVWQVRDQLISWFALRGGELARLTPDNQGIIRSDVFPGLWLDTAAALRMDPAGIHNTLHAGLASKEHAQFASLLKTRRKPD